MTVPPITDPQTHPTYAPTAFQKAIESVLYEPRDALFVRHSLLMVALFLPMQVLLFVHFSWWIAFVFWAMWGFLTPPTILMLHNTMHRPFFKKQRWLNRVHPYAMSALTGIPTGYMEHHIGMHHAENNLRGDLSSTMKYQRDNIFHWLMYFSRFIFLSHYELSVYLVSKKRSHLARRAIGSDLLHMAIMAGLAYLNWRAALAACITPYYTVRAAMMWGNWGQHAFIDASRPGDSYVNSITCINSGYNQRCFNDGYHIGHHVKQNRHWTELPGDFVANQERYLKEGCVVFEGIDFFVVSLLLFTHSYGVLAKRFVRMPGDERTDAQIIEFLKERTRRIGEDVPEGAIMNA
jgi:fatty acid desaturase